MRWVRHRDSEHKRLFSYHDLASYNDCDEFIICLSERSLNIILNALVKTEEMRTRVWTAQVGEEYEMATETQFDEFRQWLSNVYNELGSWVMCNEILLRIAEANERTATALESLDTKAQTFITWQEILDDMATTLGIAHPFYLLIKAFTDLIPSIKNVKLDPWPMITALWRTKTFEAPLLAGILGMNASLGTIAATGVGEAIANKLKALIDGISLLNDYYDQMREALIGDWNVLDFLDSVWNWFLSDEEGGEGGTDPDSDPELRAIVNIAQTIETKVLLNCESCGLQHDGGCCAGPSSGTPITEIVPGEPVEEPDPEGDPPEGYPDWPTYRNDKCIRIKDFLEKFLGTISNWATWQGFLGAITVAMVQFSLLMVLSPYLAISLATILGGLALSGNTIFSNFGTIVTYLRDHFDEIVCELKDDNSTESMVVTLSGWVNDAVDSLALGSIATESLLKSAIYTLISDDSMAYILTDTTVPVEWESYECPCEEPECGLIFPDDINGYQTVGELLSGSMDAPGTVEFGSTVMDWAGNPANPVQAIIVQSNGCCASITSSDSSGASLQWWSEADVSGCGTDVPYAQPDPIGDDCFNRIYVTRDDLSNTPFTLEITWENCS